MLNYVGWLLVIYITENKQDGLKLSYNTEIK